MRGFSSLVIRCCCFWSCRHATSLRESSDVMTMLTTLSDSKKKSRSLHVIKLRKHLSYRKPHLLRSAAARAHLLEKRRVQSGSGCIYFSTEIKYSTFYLLMYLKQSNRKIWKYYVLDQRVLRHITLITCLLSWPGSHGARRNKTTTSH